MSARILIVDDMLPSIKVLAAKLSGEYYDVLTASEGRSALEVVGEQDPDLVLLDVMMPGMDGFEVCRRIKDDPATTHIPVVMVTALSDATDRVRGLEAGADDFLTKPVGDDMLFARIRSLIRMKRVLDQWRMREETTLKLGFPPDPDAVVIDGTGSARIVLIDDSSIETSNIRQVLSRDHDSVTVLPNAGGVVDKVAKADADVLIVGFADESEDALRLCSQFRSHEETRLLPILLIGGEEDMDRLLKALELGVNDFILRPLDDEEFLARTRTQVRRKRYQNRLHANFLRSLSLALTDSLTGLHNRRYLNTHLEAVMQRMADTEKPLCLLMIDIDRFKSTNDRHGHAIGDKALCEVAQRIARNVRGFDLAARYGGEEFVVVMPDTSLEVAVAVADRLRVKIAERPVAETDSKEGVSVTVSIGVAADESGGATSKSLLKRADEALYQAKNAGRNQVIPKPREDTRIPWGADQV